MAAVRPPLEMIQECMKSTKCVRNVCILAHVDHGKTTIADSLLATNRLVSKRMAGFIRYMDDRIDEQERGITMKSSSVSLLNMVPDASGHEKPLLLNLIDTPGHIDFSSEVGAALRVCDGALVIVDLVEGVCVQTREAIKHAFTERCKMILILNKFDKLIVDLNRDPNEIFLQIIRALEDCNAIIAELYRYEYVDSEIDIEDTGLLFSPDSDNVIFASAVDGWGFTLQQISNMFINVLKDETVEQLTTKLWNFDAYVDSKSNTVKLGAIKKNKTNLFTQLCVKTIHHIYSTVVIQMQKHKVEVIAKKLNIDTITREMNHTDPKTQLRALMQAWSPLADVILKQCMQVIAPPSELEENKIKYFLDYNRFCEDEYQKSCLDSLIPDFKTCATLESTPCITYVSKMFCVDNKNLSQNKPKVFIPKSRIKNGEPPQNEPKPEETPKEEPKVVEVPKERDFSMIALARVFTGTLRVGQEIYILLPRYVPTKETKDSSPYLKSVTIKELYLPFGRELVLVDSINAGNICGIGGLESVIVRTATMSTTLNCPPFVDHPSLPPIVRNSIEPLSPKDLPVLRQGLRLLMQSDSCVQVMIEETGEYVLLTAGDVHLAKCLEDLTTKFAKIEVTVSSPMVSLRETTSLPKHKHELRKYLNNVVTVEAFHIRVTLVAVALPEAIAKEIEKNYKILTDIEEQQLSSGFAILAIREQKPDQVKAPVLKSFKTSAKNTALKNAKEHLIEAFDSSGSIWPEKKDKIWSIGRMADSINVIINATSDYSRNFFETLDERDQRSCYDNLIVKAFNRCCQSGPLCEEPLKNCAFFIKNYEVIQSETVDRITRTNINIESQLAAAFREAFEKQRPRVMEPMFTTNIQVNTNILGKVYSVVNRRHGKVLDAVGMDEQEKSFLVKAQIPVVESTGFANEMRKTTSGQAIPTLKFSHFEMIDGDPIYVPVEDDEENEDVNVEASIRATRLRKDIRKRKGLRVEEEVVVHAEKQRTLNKKK